MLKIKLTYRCPMCGNNLVLKEDDSCIYIGCERCRVYTKFLKNELLKLYKYKNKFYWKSMLRDLVEEFNLEVCH